MLTTLFLLACLDANVRGSCVPVRITDSVLSPDLTTTSCLMLGQVTAMRFMAEHPVYARPPWKFGGSQGRPRDDGV